VSVRLLQAAIATAVLAMPMLAQNGPGWNWKTLLEDRVPLFGHRNWIVIADSAYPAQTAFGIETVVSNADHFQVLQAVLQELDRSKHITPIVHLDRELQFVPEADALGISAYREQLAALLGGRPVQREPHEQIIAKLAEVSQDFRVLIIKTNLALPYTSVFLQLDCAYWSPEAERKLRSAMSEHPPPK
jgi:hypothetical protein